MKALILCALIGSAAFAQSANLVFGTANVPAFAAQFQFSALNAGNRGFASAFSIGTAAGQTVAHRYFFNRTDETYTGYDMMVTPGPDADSYRVSFRDLSLGPTAFTTPVSGSSYLAPWKKLSPPSLPHEQVLRIGQPLDIEILPDPDAARAITDQVTIQARPQMVGLPPADLQRIVTQMQSTMMAMGPRPGRKPTVVNGPARAFALDDVELNLGTPRAKVNEEPAPAPGRAAVATGALVWIYVPGHGRFILSLMPRPELGFVKAGELRGGTATFADGKDKITVESATAIAPGESAYFLYVLHDAEWAPVGDAKSALVQYGSVSVEEIRALQKK